MTFVLVGGGPTGVELAGSIAEMGSITLRSNFRRIDPSKTSILLFEGGKAHPAELRGVPVQKSCQAARKARRHGHD